MVLYVEPETGKQVKTVFVVIERLYDDHVRAVTETKNAAEKFVLGKMFGVRTAQHKREFYWVSSQDDGGQIPFLPGEGYCELYNQGSPTGVRIKWERVIQ